MTFTTIIEPFRVKSSLSACTPADMDLLRLAIPRRVYTQSHIDYAAEVVVDVACGAETLRGLRVATAPRLLRHFTTSLEPLA